VKVWKLHITDDVLVGSKVRYLSNFSAVPHFGEPPASTLVVLIGFAKVGNPPIADPGSAEIKKFDDAACLNKIKGLFSS